MYLIILLALLLVIVYVLVIFGVDNFFTYVGKIFIPIVLVIVLISIPWNRLDVKSEIEGFKQLEKTVEQSRLNGNFESAGLKIIVAEKNIWLAKTRWDKENWCNWWIPDEIYNINYIK